VFSVIRTVKIYLEDSSACDKYLDENSIDTIVTSPPYWGRRDYHDARQMGSEDALEDYAESLGGSFGNAFKKVLKKNGAMFINIGDNRKDTLLMQKPDKVKRVLERNGWLLKDEIIWFKTDPTPSSSKKNFTGVYEKIFYFVLSKENNFFYDKVSIDFSDKMKRLIERTAKVGNRKIKSKYNDPKVRAAYVGGCQYNKKIVPKSTSDGARCWNIWAIEKSRVKEGHSAPFPIKIPEIAIKATCPRGGTVLDPFVGSGTTILAAMKYGMNVVGFDTDLNAFKFMNKRILFMQNRLGYKFLFHGPHGLEDYKTFRRRMLKWVK